jgi:enoyl-CoA hydratase
LSVAGSGTLDAQGWFRLDRDGGVTTVTFDRPPANTLSYEVYDALSRLLDELESDEATRVVLFASANPKIFISGADIGDMESYDRRRGAVARKVDTVHATFLRVQRFAKPTIGVITGHALGGGCEFALCLDFRLMSRGRARVGLPEVNLGIIPGGGGTQRLSRLLGRARATELLMLGSRLDADEAAAVGLVHSAHDDADKTMQAAQDLARRLAKQAPVALRGIKRALNDGLDGDLARGLGVEREAVIEALDTADAREGVAAFLAKREPRFEGR